MNKLFYFIVSSLLCFFSFQAKAQTYFLNGNATSLGGDCYRLTTELPTQNGTVWYADQLNLNDPFSLQFQMNFGSLDANGADGICFVLQTVGTGAIGTSGGGMGYQNFGTSLGIEFDTWQNADFGDPFEDHVAIEINGEINHNTAAGNVAGPVAIDPFNINVEDGDDHVVQITWEPDIQSLKVYFDCVFRLEGTVDLINTVFNGNSLVYWGFTAATGGSFNNQTVCLTENILSVNEVSICAGASAVLSAGNSLDGTYSWTPTDYLDDPTSPTPTTTTPSSMTYVVEFTDLCGTSQTTEINVTVAELEVTVSSIDPLTCLNPTDVVNAQINLTLPVQYAWTFNGSTSFGSPNGNYTADEVGSYIVTANYNNECYAEFAFDVQGNFETLPTNAGPDNQITCDQTSVAVSANNAGSNAAYVWSLGNTIIATNQSFTATVPGTYTITIVNTENGCESTDNMVIILNNTPPSLNLPDQDTLNCVFRTLPIQGFTSSATNITVEWSTLGGNILSGANSLSPTIAGPGVYEVSVTNNDNGCESNELVTIYADETFYIDVTQIRFPNIITLNGDQLNNEWKPFLSYDTNIDLIPLFSKYNLLVFNRWGDELENLGSAKTWIPRDLEPGVYYYILDYSITCGQTNQEVIEGNIQIVD